MALFHLALVMEGRSMAMVTMSTATLGAFLCLHAHENDGWLWDEHPRNSKHCECHQDPWQRLSKHRGRVLLPHSHCNQGVDDAWWIVHGRDPLVENHVVHVTEEADHENHHGAALAEEVHRVAFMN